MDTRYKIRVILSSGKQLTYSVDKYEIIDGGLIRFIDYRTSKILVFDARSCQIEEVFQNE